MTIATRANISVNNAGTDFATLKFSFSKEGDEKDLKAQVIDIIEEFESYSINVDVYDPWASKEEVMHEYNFELLSDKSQLGSDYNAIVVAVSHNEFLELDLNALKSDIGVIFDVKSLLPENHVDSRL